MLEKPVSSGFWFARHGKSIFFLIGALAAVGGFLAFTIPVSVFPSTDFPRIVIGVDNGVMPIEQMLVTVTRPLEEAVNTVPGVDHVKSTTSRGSAEISLFFNWNVDMYQTLQRVDAALSSAQSRLPATAKVESHRLTFASFPILGYSLTSDTVSQSRLWEIANYDLKPRLSRLGGVASVVVQGGEEPEYQITPDPAKLLTTNVTVTDLLDAVKRTNLVDSPGLLEQNHQLVMGLLTGQVKTPEELGQIVVKNTSGGIPISIGDVALVSRSVTPVYTVVTANGKPAVLINIKRQPESNTVTVADEMESELAQIRQTLPAGVNLETFYDQSQIVRESIRSVRDAIFLGLVLASIIMVLFLRDWGTSVVAGVVIPVTVLFTFIALKLIGQSFNLMTLGGLAAGVGLVIDDAIVVVENIVLHRHAGEGTQAAIQNALREITVPLIGSTVTPVVVFLPLIYTTGVVGSFFRALAITMTVSLLTSLLLAVSLTPTLSQYLIRSKGIPRKGKGTESNQPSSNTVSLETSSGAVVLPAEESTSGFFGKVVAVYEPVLRNSLRHPWWLAGFSALLIVISFLGYRALGSDLLPEMDEGGFIVDYIMPAGSSLQETNRVVAHIEKLIRAVPEVTATSRRTGIQLGLAAVTEANTGDISVKLKGTPRRNIDEVIADVRSQILQAEPVVHIEVIQILQDMIDDLVGTPQPIEVKLYSADEAQLRQYAPLIADKIGKIPGVVDVLDGIENTISGPVMSFRVKPTVTARAGFTPEEISTDSTAILQGVPAVTPVIVNGRAYNIRIRFPSQNRESLESMSNTLLTSSTGRTATLGSLTELEQLPGQLEIRRENLQRMVAVTGRLEGADLGSSVARVKNVVAGLHIPSSIRVEYGGTYQEQQSSFHDLAIVLVLALVLVFIVLLFEFGNFSAPLAILCSALLSTSGVILALLITQKSFNVSSFMGLIMVVGIVAKNGILLLDADKNFRAAGLAPEDAIIQTGRRRLRPIVMTALAAVAGMLPLALALGAGSEMLQPLAISVIGGIMISMVLSLIITPAIYFYLNRAHS